MCASFNYKLLQIYSTTFLGAENTGDGHVNGEAPRQTPKVQSPALAQRILEQTHLATPRLLKHSNRLHIHAVPSRLGSVWRPGDEDQLLSGAV
jgi:hypothetical protein